MFKVTIKQVPTSQEEEITITCHEINDEVIAIMNKLKETSTKTLIGFQEDKMFTIRYEDIYYIEATENKTFIYCEDEVYESKMKLYEIEMLVALSGFFRCSKSMLLHVDKIKYVSSAFNGRFNAKLTNNEEVIISRQYVPDLKKLLGI